LTFCGDNGRLHTSRVPGTVPTSTPRWLPLGCALGIYRAELGGGSILGRALAVLLYPAMAACILVVSYCLGLLGVTSFALEPPLPSVPVLAVTGLEDGCVSPIVFDRAMGDCPQLCPGGLELLKVEAGGTLYTYTSTQTQTYPHTYTHTYTCTHTHTHTHTHVYTYTYKVTGVTSSSRRNSTLRCCVISSAPSIPHAYDGEKVVNSSPRS
jgi:hypothetical protein